MNKIMYLLNYVGDGGSEKYVLDLIQSIDPKRCVLVYSTPGPFLHKFEKLNIPIYRIEMHHPFDIQAARKLKKIIAKEQVDIVHAQFLRENYIAILAKLLGASIRVIWTYHVDVPMARPLRWCNAFFTRYNDTIICISQFMKQQLLEKGVQKDKLKMIYNGLEDPYSNALPALHKPMKIAVIGRLSEEKGQPFFIRSLHKLKTQYPSLQWQCNIIGDGPLKSQLENLITTLQLDDSVSLLGFQDNIIKEYEAHDIIVIPSKNEGLSYVAIEAIAMKKPVIATNIGGLPEVIVPNQSGISIPYGDEEQLATALARLLQDEKLYHSLAECGREYYLQNFTFSKMLTEVNNIYRIPSSC
ncbi:glycosyltransferase family 1 protein [Bacillus cereus]|uniref:glycosyltransferase n=1 Tax=Bacillus TaxID=1386 RepID=UPI000479CC0F|nr:MULTISPECIES: glycosyltransferase [Bacillus]PFE04852.1 glycosyltransferase family 1 protein [Bacillus sp. AFS023182]PGX95979.1 glycosyltransferase family 1 protein [Bacillus cereus]WIY60862.1 glycosyltransferase [Bacillus arachidis]SDZ30552.1 Glycosyltransferase involved in cell wall bisynthesis [Bacillus sp. 166amftsu]